MVSLACSRASATAYVGSGDVLLYLFVKTYPEIISAIDIPLHHIALPLRRKRVEAVVLRDTATLRIRLLLMLLVVAMVGVEDVGELANLVLGMDGLDVGIAELSVLKLLLDLLYLFAELVVEGVEEFLEAAL